MVTRRRCARARGATGLVRVCEFYTDDDETALRAAHWDSRMTGRCARRDRMSSSGGRSRGTVATG